MPLLRAIVLLGLVALGDFASNSPRSASTANVTNSGAPRHVLDSVTPTIDINEGYIRAKVDISVVEAVGPAVGSHCDADRPCNDGSCCNSDGKVPLPLAQHSCFKLSGN